MAETHGNEAPTRPTRRTKERQTVEPVGLARDVEERVAEEGGQPRPDPELTGGDIDADWRRAAMSGEEAPGGGQPTPDQDLVDDAAAALGVEEDIRSPLHGVAETMIERDRRRWDLEEEASAEAEGRTGPGGRPR